MEYTTGSVGRCIVIRLHEDDAVYSSIEKVATDENIDNGLVFMVGGVKNGGVVVGPQNQDERPLKPTLERFADAREIAGTGTLFRNDEGTPKLHLHAAIGKGNAPLVGCPRQGLDCWLITEVVIIEITGIDARRVKEAGGLELLKIFASSSDA
ncbi:MAG: PPC domain-containing DNA-binding protein [Chitinispirillaceae bacterium]